MADPTNAAGAIGTSGLGAALPFVGTALGALETGINIVDKIGAKKRINGLLNQRQAFQTSGQIYDILNATLNQSQGDTITRDFQTNQISQGLSNSLGVASRLGANPNDLSGLFQNSVNGIMQVGQEFHQSNTQAFSNVINAYKLLADNKDAEYASQQGIVKDKLAAAGANLNTANQNIGNGLNTILGSLSSKATGDLFKQGNNNGTTINNSVKQDLGTMLNDYLFKNQVNDQLAGPITNADSFGSIPNNNNTFA